MAPCSFDVRLVRPLQNCGQFQMIQPLQRPTIIKECSKKQTLKILILEEGNVIRLRSTGLIVP